MGSGVFDSMVRGSPLQFDFAPPFRRGKFTYGGDRVDSSSPSSSTAAACTTGTGNELLWTAPTPTNTTATAT